jgi:hypothetical protein
VKNSRKEDIEILEKLISTMKSDRKLFNEKIDKEIYTFFINALEHILSDYKRVLQENEYMHNELDKQQTKINKYAKENEELKENCNIDYKRECEVLALQLHLLREEAKTTEKDYNMLKEYYKEQNEVNARFIPVQKVKDKIIDLMSEQLAGLAIFNIDKDETLILSDKEEVKQYYENKAKELINR